MGLRERLAASLRRLRGQRGWTQIEAAEAAGMDVRHYQRLEGAKVSATLDTVDTLAAAFDVDVADLLGDGE